jgi:hypothetical protein
MDAGPDQPPDKAKIPPSGGTLEHPEWLRPFMAQREEQRRILELGYMLGITDRPF